MAPEAAHVLIPSTSHHGRDFADLIQLRIARWRHYPVSLDGPSELSGSCEREAGGTEPDGAVVMDAEGGVT